MSKHTPGPWKAVGDKIYTKDVRQVATIYPIVNPEDVNAMESMPNARLIAAAPEMFEFIRKVLRWELVDCDIHEHVMDDDEVRDEAQKLLLKIFPDYYQTK